MKEVKNITLKEQIINARKRGLSIKLIAECTHLSENKVRGIIYGRSRAIQRKSQLETQNR